MHVRFCRANATDQVHRVVGLDDSEFAPLNGLLSSLSSPGEFGEGYNEQLISADGSWAVGLWDVHATGIAWWLDKITPRPSRFEARLISLRDQSYWVFPWSYEDDKPDDAVLSVSLSPHGRRAIYDKDGRWYVTELPTRENGQWK